MIRIAVVGTGFAEQTQIPAFLFHPDAEVVAIVSRRLERAKRVAERYGIPCALDDLDDVWSRNDVDAISIATPPALHAPMAEAALRRGLHVLCEKPMALNLGQAARMLDLARRSGRVHAIDHEFRYTPARMFLRRLVQEGALGTVHTVRITHYRNFWHNSNLTWGWLFDERQGGGILGAMGSHLIDMVLWTFGPVRTVGALLDSRIGMRPDERGKLEAVTADDTFTLLMQLEGGTQAVVQVTGVAATSAPLEVEVHGSRDSVLLKGNEQLLQRKGDRSIELPVPAEVTETLNVLDGALQGGQERLRPFLALADEWVKAMEGRPVRFLPTFEDGLAVQRVLDAARESSASGKIISLE